MRPLVGLIAMALIVGACGADEAAAPDPSPESDDQPEADPADQEPAGEAIADVSGDITVWAWEGTVEPLQSLEDNFAEAYPNVNVNWEVLPPADVYQQLQLAATAGSGLPDVVLLEDSHLTRFMSQGVLTDLTDQVDPYREDLNEFKVNVATMDGSIYAMPWDSGPVALFYRTDVFEEAGVNAEEIETWADYREIARTVQDETGVAMWQQARAQNDGRLFETLMWQRGHGYINDDGEVILDTEPEIEEVLDYIASFWEDGLAADTEPWTDAWYGEMNDGEVASIPGAVWMGTFLKSFIAPDTGGLWGIVELPAWEPGGVRASNDGGSQFAIPVGAENQDAAWAWIEFHVARVDSQVEMYKQADLFPAFNSAYGDPYFDESDPYFSDVRAAALFAEVVEQIPVAGVYNPDYPEMNEVMSVEIQQLATGGHDSAADALKAAADRIRSSTGRN